MTTPIIPKYTLQMTDSYRIVLEAKCDYSLYKILLHI